MLQLVLKKVLKLPSAGFSVWTENHFKCVEYSETCRRRRRSAALCRCIKLALMSDQTGDGAPVKVLVSPNPTVTPASQQKPPVFSLFLPASPQRRRAEFIHKHSKEARRGFGVAQLDPLR